MMKYKDVDIKTLTIGDTAFKLMTDEDEKKLKGYQYDSLVYRYIRAREKMAEYEALIAGCDRSDFLKQANRDIARFCHILNEVMGEHD